MNRRHLLASLVAAGVVSGCSTLPAGAAPPRISVAGLRIIEVGLLEQRYALRLRVQNPNDFAFTVTGMDYALELNGRDFAQGVSDQRVDVPAYSERTLEVTVSSGLADLVEQLRALDNGRMSGLDYRVHGHVRLDGGTRVPFEHAAELLPSSPGRAPDGGTLRSTNAGRPAGRRLT